VEALRGQREPHNLRRDFRRVTAAAGLGARWVPKELPGRAGGGDRAAGRAR